MQQIPTPCMPSGSPAPYLMTADELAQFMRLDVKFPRDTIERMRKEHGLRAVRVSTHVLYQLSDVLDFLREEQERNPTG